MNEFLNYVQECLLSIILALLSLGTVFVIKYIDKLKNKITIETNEIKDKATKDLINNYVDQLDKLIRTTVYSIEQEIASEIRKKIASGDPSVSRDDLVALKDQAYNTIIDSVNPNILDYLSEIVEDTDQYILDKISEEVNKLKNSELK